MPETATTRAVQSLLAIEQAVESGELEVADRLSRILHDQVTDLQPEESSALLKDLTRVIDAARSSRRQLRERLRDRRTIRQGVSAYQSVTG